MASSATKEGKGIRYAAKSRTFEVQLKALGSIVRMNILRAVADGPKSVWEISNEVGLSQPSASSQMNILWTAGFLSKYKRGKYVYYELDRDAFFSLQKAITEYLNLKN